MNNRAVAIIVAAGAGSRFGAPKVLIPIAGFPVLQHAVSAFLDHPAIGHIRIVTNADSESAARHLFAAEITSGRISLASGGSERQDSVRNGLAALPATDLVLVHDAARPIVPAVVIDRVLAALAEGADAVVPALPVVDTIRRTTGDSTETIDRTNLFRVQTPQGFRIDVLRQVLEHSETDGSLVTDEAVLVERLGRRVVIVPGSERLHKVTTPADVELIERMAGEQKVSRTRTGIGYDVHRLVPGRDLVLGGVRIPFALGLDGHSDADVLIHAIADALLGTFALGDIGQHFPPTDPKWQGMSSLLILEHAAKLVGEAGGEIISIDATVIAEAPKIGP
ncbi:MAG TPA: 2-C-methyl-D-erythritol 4-phosphate cytidylyltransferase, partial [Thermomicrobiales bacterium]|nr:2-C-methyl-D-erythritol 4-phosphate cytidylyltransferase [Thermomicrobiales bacterium]